MRWTEEQLAEYRARKGVPAFPDTSNPPLKLPGNEPGRFALGRLPVGAMNKTEAEYERHLALLRNAGQVLWFKFEAVKLRLADNTFYTPDFGVLAADGVFELHEVKGFWEDDARVKIKVAATLFPFRFKAIKVLAKKHGGGWETEEF